MSDQILRSRWDMCDDCDIAVIVERDTPQGVPDEEMWQASLDCPVCGSSLRFHNADEQTQANMSWGRGRRAGYSAAVRDFLNFVASSAAFNGAPDVGQRFYDEGLNPWLDQAAQRFRDRANVTAVTR